MKTVINGLEIEIGAKDFLRLIEAAKDNKVAEELCKNINQAVEKTKTSKHKAWNKKDKVFLKKNYRKLTNAQIAKELGIERQRVNNKIFNMRASGELK